MKTKIYKRSRMTKCGITVAPTGLEHEYANDKAIYSSVALPMKWKGADATMHFFGGEYGEYNPIASRILNHPDLPIHGSVHIITHVVRLYKMRVWASHQDVVAALAHVMFDYPPIIMNVGWSTPQQDIYTLTERDQFWVKMAL
ncbi:hypothetical protein ACRBEV_12265 [Methylobacterium phyllosphaerae]